MTRDSVMGLHQAGHFVSSGVARRQLHAPAHRLIEDGCGGALTRVKSGKVSVRDFVLKKNVTVKAGESYVASPARRLARKL